MIDGEELIVMLDKAEMDAMQAYHRNHAYCKGLRDAIKMTRVLLDAEDTCDLKETIPLTGDEAESIISFIKGHEREDIPDEVWDICMRLCDETERV